MTLITATDTFDEEELDPEVAQDLEPLIEWLNSNNQNFVAALQGGLGDKNLTTKTVQVSCESNVLKSVAEAASVSHVEISRVEAEPNTKLLVTGFNWFPTGRGFDFVVTFTPADRQRNVFLRVHFNV